MVNLCRCGRDIHPSPLSETVAGFYESHSFPEDYDPETDPSPYVCPGSFTEGPIRPPKQRSTGFGMTGNIIDGLLKGFENLSVDWPSWFGTLSNSDWKVVGTVADEGITYKTWLPGDEGYSCDFGKAKFTVKLQSGNPYYSYHATPYVIYDEMWDHWQPPKKECPGDLPMITFGPENWVKKPSDPLFGWKPWESCLYADIYGIPPINHSAWKEPIPLPDLPVDYTEVAKQFNEQFSSAGVK